MIYVVTLDYSYPSIEFRFDRPEEAITFLKWATSNIVPDENHQDYRISLTIEQTEEDF